MTSSYPKVVGIEEEEEEALEVMIRILRPSRTLTYKTYRGDSVPCPRPSLS
jgi:hypothetical protein